MEDSEDMKLPKTLKSPITIIAIVAVQMMFAATSCYFESANSGAVGADNFPYFAQEGTYYCGAAVVQMLAKWSGVNVTQYAAFFFMAGNENRGVTIGELLNGIHYYTNLSDAGIDTGQPSDNNYWARQIGSVSNRIPVACVVSGGDHTGVLYYGSWHATATSNTQRTYIWDTVYFHDPQFGAGLQYSAGPWRDYHCNYPGYGCVQIISAGGAASGPKTLADYNPVVYVAGEEPRDHGPYAY